MTGTNLSSVPIESTRPSESSKDYVSRHQQQYQERLRKESEVEMIQSDEALAKSLQDQENMKFADHSHASDIHNSIQHPENLEEAVRAPLRTGYTERLIDDEAGARANRVRNPSRIWSMFSRRAFSESSESLLPPPNSDSGTFGQRLLTIWISFILFVRTYLALIITFLAVVVILAYVLSQRD